VTEILILVLVIVWFADRARLRRRLDALESAVEHLTRAGAMERAARHSEPAPAPAEAAALTPTVQSANERVDDPRDQTDTFTAPFGPQTSEARDTEATWSQGDWAARPPAELPGLRLIRDFFTGGNLIVRVGVVILFFGVAFLLRYLAEHSHLSIEMRLSGVAVGALVLLGLGWYWRTVRRGYALALQGGGVGILYLTTFTAQRFYLVLAPSAAFPLLAAIAVLSAALAILQDSMAFAMLGVTGGYLAPVLAANPQGDHIALFSYFALLNTFVLIVAWFRSWRPLNLLAFTFTYVIGTVWGVLRYQPEQFATTEPFVALFFAMFVTLSILYAIRRGTDLRHYVDGTLIFGVPVVTLGFQAGLVRHIPYALAYSALTLSALYLALAWTLYRRRQETIRLLVEAFLALGVAFATLAIPFALEGHWTAASWALEGAAIFWVGLRQERRLALASGLALEFLAAVFYTSTSIDARSAVHAPLFFNAHYLAAILISVGSLAIAAMLRRRAAAWLEPWRPALSASLFAWGLFWWLGAGHTDIDSHLAPQQHLAVEVGYFGVTALLLTLLGARIGWTGARFVASLLPVALGWFALESLTTAPHPLAEGGWWAWPASLAVAYFALRRDESIVPAWLRALLHAVGAWLMVWALTSELAWQTAQVVAESPTWSDAVLGLLPAAALLVIMKQSSGTRWPFAGRPLDYVAVVGGGLAAYLALWSLYSDVTSDGYAAPLPYVPLLSPMDIAQALGILALAAHWRAVTRFFNDALNSNRNRTHLGALGLIVFAWLNVLLLRTLHEYAAVPYTLDAMAASTLAQTSLTIFWTTLALVAMAWASRSGRRIIWLCGATLLGAVILKLFLVDLSRTGTVLRIVSFLGVGILMLVIGYLSPLPPRRTESVA
jgi:uncharacterized membrane protein